MKHIIRWLGIVLVLLCIQNLVAAAGSKEKDKYKYWLKEEVGLLIMSEEREAFKKLTDDKQKDEFIELNLRKRCVDEIEEAARELMNTEAFQKVERSYKKEDKQKSIPSAIIFELASTQFGYLNRNNEVRQIGDRVKLIGITERGWVAGKASVAVEPNKENNEVGQN